MFRPDGAVAWTYPSPWTGVHGSHTAPKERLGQLVGPLGVMGTARVDGLGEIFAFHTNVGTGELFTADGLYLGRIFRDTRAVTDPWPDRPQRGQSLMNMTNGGEWFGGQFFQHPDGRVFVIASRHAGVIAEVTGLQTAGRLPAQDIEFTPEHYAQVQQTRPSDTTDEGQQKSIRISRISGADGKPPPLTAFRWDATHAAQWRYDEKRGAKATWGWDDTHLYIAFQVDDDTPMVNGGEDIRTLFKSGDAAILELRTDPEIRSAQPSPGDLRLLLSVYKGKPVAVLYDYRNPAAADRVEFISVKTTRIDAVEIIQNAAIAIERTCSGYILRAAVDLKALDGWQREPNETYAGDFGIIYSDRTGATNVLRMYWSNMATGIVSDLSLEAAIQPAHWGRFATGR
jgi:hypothetical protein